MMIVTTIEEPLIYNTICSFLNLCEVDQLRRTCRTFLDVGNHILRDVNVIATCGLYTIRTTDVVLSDKYYAPCLDIQIDSVEIDNERECYFTAAIDTLNCVLIKNDVDHVLFGNYFGFIKHDHIELKYANFSTDTLDGKPWDLMTTSYAMATYLDNRTMRYVVDKNLSLRRSLFEEAIVIVGSFKHTIMRHWNNNEFDCKIVDEGLLIKSKSGKITIEEFHKVTRACITPSKIMFDGRLIFY